MTSIKEITLQWAELRPAGGFDLLMVDPPWRFQAWSAAGEGKNPSQHYECQPGEWIERLPLQALAAPNALVWLWAIAPMLPAALRALDAWGFDFKTMGYWTKTTKHGKIAFGTGYILRGAGEPFLIGTRGSPKTSRNVRSALLAQVREHSRKPDEAFAAAERLMPHARRIEIFSREHRPGWTTWGDEAGKFGGVA